MSDEKERAIVVEFSGSNGLPRGHPEAWGVRMELRLPDREVFREEVVEFAERLLAEGGLADA